ncbi:hypothetical protein D3C83_161220 [compost metagenome]
MKDLFKIDLSETSTNDEALAHLAALPALQWLNLWNSFVTDEGLAHLKAAKKLTYLNLEGTSTSPEVIAELKNELPKLEVVTQ